MNREHVVTRQPQSICVTTPLYPLIQQYWGKHSSSLQPGTDTQTQSQICTGINFQFESLHVDTGLTFFNKSFFKKITNWNAWVEKSGIYEMLSPVGSVAWLARKQLIPNVGFSFFHSLIQQWPEAWLSLNV